MFCLSVTEWVWAKNRKDPVKIVQSTISSRFLFFTHVKSEVLLGNQQKKELFAVLSQLWKIKINDFGQIKQKRKLLQTI